MIEQFFERLIARFQADASTFPEALANFDSVADAFGNIWLHYLVLAVILGAGVYLFDELMERYLVARVIKGKPVDVYTDMAILSGVVITVLVVN